MRRALLALLLVLLPLPASAREEVVLGLSQSEVAITATFDGSRILIFGAVKREAPVPEGPPLQVVVTVAGPSMPLTVWRKSRRFGIWVNTDSVRVDAAPSFYAVATSGPFDKVLTHVEDLRHHVSIERAVRAIGATADVADAPDFVDAVIRIRREAGLYKIVENAAVVDQQTLFRTAIDMPSNVTEGKYRTRIFLTRAGRVVSLYETEIDVRKVGLERWLYNLSRQNPPVYGLMSIAIAIAAGWGASAAFRVLRRG